MLCIMVHSGMAQAPARSVKDQVFKRAATAPEINFEYIKQVIDEDTGSVNIMIRVDNWPDTPMTVNLMLEYRNATDSVDFYFTDRTVILTSASTAVNVPIVDDDSVETEEIMVLRLTNPSSGSSLGDDYDTIVIKDNDGPPTSIKKIRTEVKFSVYPNPAKDILIIDSEEQQLDYFIIRDIIGNEILKKPVQKNRSIMTWDISALKPGVYMIEGKGPGKDVVKKIIVE